MIVQFDEEWGVIRLRKEVDEMPYEVIPIEDLLDAWEKQKAEMTTEESSTVETGLCASCKRENCVQKTERIDECNGYIRDTEQTDCPWK